MFDYHVHVSGTPVQAYKNCFVKDKLSSSLKESGVDGFLGIVASGTLFPYVKHKSAEQAMIDFLENSSKDIGLNYDGGGDGLSIVRELGGEPAVFLHPYSLSNNKHLIDVLSRMNDEDIRVVKLYMNEPVDISPLTQRANDYGVSTILFHTPTNRSIIEPVFELVNKAGLQAIMGHGCYDDKVLMNLVRDYGFFVDTSINPIELVNKWVSGGLERQLVFGSDWPSSPGQSLELDWKGQTRELKKISDLKNIISKNEVRL